MEQQIIKYDPCIPIMNYIQEEYQKSYEQLKQMKLKVFGNTWAGEIDIEHAISWENGSKEDLANLYYYHIKTKVLKHYIRISGESFGFNLCYKILNDLNTNIYDSTKKSDTNSVWNYIYQNIIPKLKSDWQTLKKYILEQNEKALQINPKIKEQ